ncbi:MAG: choice-of-anchor J domain-containing protein [Bacteroidia bacterium]|nr:choice-of-anchor J domain-containing protein [Bacteroidia bacterium]
MNFLRFSSLLLLAMMVLASCKREFDEPPIKSIPVGDIVTCADVRAMFQGAPIKITEDKTVYGTITSDERNGNFYKEAYMQDATGALYLRLTASGGLYKGDSIRLNLNGTTLQDYNGMFQVDSVNVDNNIVKVATLREVKPQVITIDQIGDAWEAHLIQIDSAEFSAADVNTTWADAVSLFALNHDLKDCNGNTVLVRTSGYSNFASDTIPSGRGKFIGVLSEYKGDFQLFVREPAELGMTATRCGGGSSGCTPKNGLNEDFNDATKGSPIASPCWTNVAVIGTRVWAGQVFGSDIYAEGTSYQSSDASNEMWLISPSVQSQGKDTLTFDCSMAYWDHDALSVWISTNFTPSDIPTGSDVTAATWTQVTCSLPGSSATYHQWYPTGAIELRNFLGFNYQGTYHIGFKYEGSSPGGLDDNYRLDNIVIKQ